MTARTTSSEHCVRMSAAPEDAAWDAFLRRVGAHHTQSSRWAQVKRADGWSPRRVVVEDRGRIVAGAQLLCRHLGGLGNIAYLAQGPVCAGDEPELLTATTRGVELLCRDARLHAVLIEPDGRAGGLHGPWADRLVPAHRRLSLGATTIVDLAKDPDDLLAVMHRKTRYNVRLALRRGITVRHGGAADLPRFHRLLERTGRRQGFRPDPLATYQRWFEVLAPEGHLAILIAELRGEPVSAMLAIPFGDTVVYKRGAWTGEHGDLRPNEALHWAAMTWAHDAGYRWYDLDGIDADVAAEVLRGRPVPQEHRGSVTRFKLGFGGEVVLRPPSQLHLRGALLRHSYARFGERVSAGGRVPRHLARQSG